MKKVEIKITVVIPEHYSGDEDDFCSEIVSHLNYSFSEITGSEIYDIETEVIE